jgi:hypothetical protein
VSLGQDLQVTPASIDVFQALQTLIVGVLLDITPLKRNSCNGYKKFLMPLLAEAKHGFKAFRIECEEAGNSLYAMELDDHYGSFLVTIEIYKVFIVIFKVLINKILKF